MVKKEFIKKFRENLERAGIKTGDMERERFIKNFFELLGEEIIENQLIKFEKVGAFELKQVKGKRIMNPSTKEIMVSNPPPVIKFRTSKNSDLYKKSKVEIQNN